MSQFRSMSRFRPRALPAVFGDVPGIQRLRTFFPRTLPTRFTVLALTLVCVAVPARDRTVQAAPSSPAWVAAAIGGNIVLFHADGSGLRTITHGGSDSSPHLSPDGRSVAFLRSTGGRGTYRDMSTRQVVMIASRSGEGYSIRRYSSGSLVILASRRQLAWDPAPGSFGLAWFDSAGVIARRGRAAPKRVLRLPAPGPFDSTTPIAWSPDGAQIAAPLSTPTGVQSPPSALPVAIARLGTGRQRNITIRFRPGILGGPPPRGSYPVGDDLVFAPGNHRLYLTTVRNGAGREVTGVFEAPDGGGVARMILGRGNGVHGYPPYGYGLGNATRFLSSPNGKYVATDPNNQFWISGAVDRLRTITVLHAPSCVVSQWTWLTDSSGLAYVTACTAVGPLYRLTLASVSRFGGKPHVLVAFRSRDQNTIDLSRSTRCIACGG